VRLNPDAARQWGETWREKHAPGWKQLSGAGLVPVTTEERALLPGETRHPHSRDTILTLERQINGGRQLSLLDRPIVASKPTGSTGL
jgi:hypothetical protein